MFPYEYQKALAALAAEKSSANATVESPKVEPQVKDIEEAVNDEDMEKKKLDKILDKTKYVFYFSFPDFSNRFLQVLMSIEFFTIGAL